jgi:transcriptional regulator with XRE-family HTH domain
VVNIKKISYFCWWQHECLKGTFSYGENTMGKFIGSNEIGRRVREFRQKAGYTQEKLAEMLGISFQQVQKYENGTSKLNTDRLQKIADALSISIYAFFDSYADAPYTLSNEERRLVEAYREIKDESARNGFLAVAEHAARK